MKVKKLLLKQHDPGEWLGGTYVLINSSMFYQGLMSQAIVLGMAYNTTYRDWLSIYFPWINFPLFFLFLLAGLATLMLIDYKFVYRARTKFGNKQAKYANPYLELTGEVNKKVDELTKQIALLRQEIKAMREKEILG